MSMASRLLCSSVVVPFAVSLALAGQAPAPTKAAKTGRKKHVAHHAGCLACGKERWDVKTLSDPAASGVNFQPAIGTVSQLTALAAPASGGARHPSEMQTYTVRAKLVGYKQEYNPNVAPGKNPGDRDFHIVLQDLNSSDTMIVEIPDSRCLGVCTSIKLADITKARADFADGVVTPPGVPFLMPTQIVEVEVTGVVFFDFAHGQTGLARNCIEIHPVLDFKFLTPGKVTAAEDPAGEPKAQPKSFYHCLPQIRPAKGRSKVGSKGGADGN
jgi:hypothetical protein